MRFKELLRSQTALCTPLLMVLGAATASAADLMSAPAPIAVPAIPVTDLPAVSGVNGKLGISGGGASAGRDDVFFFFDDDDDFEEAWLAEAALSVPLGHRFGAQGDGVVGMIHDELFAHGAGHLFWRDPSAALIGAYGSYSVWDDLDRWRVGVEAEAYFGRVSLEGILGWETGDVDDDVFSIADIAFYPTENFRLSLGHRYSSPGHIATAGLEWQFASGANVGWAAFADGRVGENDYQAIFAGLRLYFGSDKSLIRRHREDDPRIKTDAFSLTGCTEDIGAIASDSTVLDGAVVVDSEVIADSFDAPCGEDLPRLRLGEIR